MVGRVTPFTTKDVRILSEETVFHGYFSIKQFQLQHRLFAGGWGETIQRELFERGNAGAALPYDPKLNKVILIEQFRIGAYHDAKSPWLVECIAGARDHEDESMVDMIHREAQEEAGLVLLDLIPICNYWVSPGGTSERTALYCAKVDASDAGGIFGLPHEGEDIRASAWDVDDAFAAVSAGDINNAASIIALQWLQINLEYIQKKWSE